MCRDETAAVSRSWYRSRYILSIHVACRMMDFGRTGLDGDIVDGCDTPSTRTLTRSSELQRKLAALVQGH